MRSSTAHRDAQDEFLQTIGFTPAEVARQYAENRALKDRERHILDRRKALLAAYAMALHVDDREAVLEVRHKIVAFNKAYPEKPITGQTIQRSLRGRQAYSDRAEHGVAYDAALRRRVAEEEGGGAAKVCDARNHDVRLRTVEFAHCASRRGATVELPSKLRFRGHQTISECHFYGAIR